MMKYVDVKVTFSEVPDEISLCVNISNCPYRCPNCHSSYLQEDIGTPINPMVLKKLIHDNEGISCICFMGGDANHKYINELALFMKDEFPHLKVAWYSGSEEIPKEIDLWNFDYIKIKPYIEEKGPLTDINTNQKFYRVFHLSNYKSKLADWTYKFRRNND